VIDWKDFCQALTEIGFDGVFSYETAPNSKMPEPVRTEVLKMMTELADLLVEQ
jgi:sugar phosphate isomerase/epimerase